MMCWENRQGVFSISTNQVLGVSYESVLCLL